VSDRREARLLLAIAAERWDEARALAAPRAAVFLDLARACDVAPFLHARLEAEDRFALVGEPVRAGLEAIRRKTRHDNLLLLARLEEALDLLLGAGIVPVALKGVDVLHRLYSRFDERTLDDVDLLVPPAQAAAAIAVLEKAGWTGPGEPERTHWLRSSFEMPLKSPGPVEVAFEIHWSLGQERRYAIDTAGVLARARPLQAAGRPILRLDDHDAAAHHLMHHLQHYFDRRLKWAIDLGRIAATPGFRWEIVAERLEAWGGLAAAGLSLLHLAKIHPPAAPSAARRLVPAAAWRRLVTLPLRSSHPMDLFRATRRRGVQLVLAAAALERPGDLPGYLRHRAVRDREGDGPRGGA
jgi:hypothetical protein